MPDDATQNVAHTSTLANNFLLNTDYNYRKLKASGTFTAGGQTYTHNLGYIPQVMAWVKYKDIEGLESYSRNVAPLVTASYYTDYLFEVTPTTIGLSTATFPFLLIEKVIWRVYYDEA